MEVEQYNLTLQISQMTHVTFVIEQSDIQYTSLLNLAGLDLNVGILSLYDTLVLHAFDGNVVQVLSALSVWVISVPAGSNGCKSLDIFLVGTRIENQVVADSLEQSEVGICLVRLFVDIVALNLFLVSVNHALDAVVGLGNA